MLSTQVTLSPDERALLAVNYTSGSAAVLPVTEDGLGPASDMQV